MRWHRMRRYALSGTHLCNDLLPVAFWNKADCEGPICLQLLKAVFDLHCSEGNAVMRPLWTDVLPSSHNFQTPFLSCMTTCMFS